MCIRDRGTGSTGNGGGTNPTNQAPVVNAGATNSATVGNAVTLAGSVSDDGLPANATLTSTWSVTSGSGSVNFANPASPTTAVTFSAAGTYTLVLTANDGALSSTDTVNITVTSASSGGSGNTPIRINAGGPQIISNGVTWIADNPGTHGFVNTGFAQLWSTNLTIAVSYTHLTLPTICSV